MTPHWKCYSVRPLLFILMAFALCTLKSPPWVQGQRFEPGSKLARGGRANSLATPHLLRFCHYYITTVVRIFCQSYTRWLKWSKATHFFLHFFPFSILYASYPPAPRTDRHRLDIRYWTVFVFFSVVFYHNLIGTPQDLRVDMYKWK